MEIITLALMIIIGILFGILVYLNLRMIGTQGKKETVGIEVGNRVAKFASPLAYDDRIIMCSTLDEVDAARKKVEISLKDINHIWNPQELLQLLMLVKGYIVEDGKFFKSYHDYLLLRYMESLVMALNGENCYWEEHKDVASDINIRRRELIYEELKHLYYYAKLISDKDKKIYRENNNARNPQGNRADSVNGKPSKPSCQPVLDPGNFGKPAQIKVNGDEQLRNDMTNSNIKKGDTYSQQ